MQPEFNFHDNPLYKLPVAASGSAEYSAYQKVLEAADAYFAFADQAEGTPSFNTQTALYFAALAAFSTDQPERMLRYIERLAPLNYKRPLLPGQPQLAKPVAPELLRLRWGTLVTFLNHPDPNSIERVAYSPEFVQETPVHEIGHLCDLRQAIPSLSDHVDQHKQKQVHPGHTGAASCVMSYNDGSDNITEFCLPCIEHARKQPDPE